MDDLIKMVAEKAHISEEQAKEAVGAVVTFLKAKLPAPVVSQIESMLGSDVDLGDVAAKLGGLFGR